MKKIKVYAAEAELADQIQANNSVSILTKVEPLEQKLISEAGINVDIGKFTRDLLPSKSKKYEVQNDLLYPTKSVLVTSNWNKNDDVFGVSQIWNARFTPINTPTNIDHDHQQVVGHITDTWVLDAEGNMVTADTKEEDLPDTIHLCNAAVIYRFWKDQDLQDRAEKLIEEIEAGTKYVSQECLFPDFDYALSDANGKFMIVSRNEKTAFLTKHLRCYGGEGKHQEYKIGRFLKDLVFSGKGYVDMPANPESVIFSDDNPIIFKAKSCYNNLDEIKDNGVNNIEMENFSMANENLQAEIDSLKSENADLRKQMSEANVKQVKDENESLTSQLADADKQIAEANEKVASVSTELDEVKKQLDEANSKVEELTKSNDELSEKVAAAEAEKRTSARVSTLVDAGIDREKAEAQVAKFEKLDDEQFAVVADTLTEAAKMAKEKDDKKMKGEKKEDESASSVEEDSKSLDNAEVEESNAGAISDEDNSDDEVNELRLSIAKHIDPNFEGDE